VKSFEDEAKSIPETNPKISVENEEPKNQTMPSIAEVTELNKEASLQQEVILNPGTDQNINEV
jgi:hypothetical protein